LQTGLILCPLDSGEADWLRGVAERVHVKDVAVLLLGEDRIRRNPDAVIQFILRNNLKGVVVVCDPIEGGLTEPLSYAFENAGLGRLAVNYVDIGTLSPGGNAEDQASLLYAIVMVNLVRIEQGFDSDDIVSKSVLTRSGVSRRTLLRSLRRGLRVQTDIPLVLNERCGIRSKGCEHCLRACPFGAITRGDNAVIINERLCTECGACARECPVGAIQSPAISDAQLAAMLNVLAGGESESSKRALLLTCPLGVSKLSEEARSGKRLPLTIIPVSIPCVAAVGGVHYLWSAALGVSMITVCPDKSCQKSVVVLPVAEQARSCGELLRVFAGETASSANIILAGDESIVTNASQMKLASIPAGAELGVPSLSRREATIDALRVMTDNRRDMILPRAGEFIPIFDITVDSESCTLCELCRVHCPDHAIDFLKKETSLSLVFDPERCSGCGICVKHCPEDAVSLSRLGDLSVVVERMRGEKVHDAYAKCAGCGASMGSRRNLESLEKRLKGEGVSEASLRALHLCLSCKQATTVRSTWNEGPS